MTQQINLYDPALLRPREWLSASSVAAGTLAVLLAMTGWTVAARSQVAALEAESAVVAPQLKTLQQQVEALGRQVSSLRPDPRIEAELASARALVNVRGEALKLLESGLGGGSTSFAEFLRALARQSLPGLWLTGFAVGEGGTALEIRGRMTDPALLPRYIERLNSEKAFQGRAFAALQVSPGKPPAAEEAPGGVAPSAGWHDFVLAPEVAPARPADPSRDRPAEAAR